MMRIQTVATVDTRIGKKRGQTDPSNVDRKDPGRPVSPKSPSAPLPVNRILIEDHPLLITSAYANHDYRVFTELKSGVYRPGLFINSVERYC